MAGIWRKRREITSEVRAVRWSFMMPPLGIEALLPLNPGPAH
jgi:hypothetical protein